MATTKVICSWCGKTWSKPATTKSGISHGICETCKADFLKPIAKTED